MVNSEQSNRARRKLSDEERSLWAGFTRSVVRLGRPAKETESSQATKRRIVSEATENPRTAAPRAKSTAPVSSLMRRDRQRLSRGRQPVDGHIDLHGKTQREAHAILLRFVRRAQEDGAKFILVVTGKGGRGGVGAAEGGILRRQVPVWLSLPEFSRYVSAFGEADAAHGGAGALYVQLRGRKPVKVDAGA
jgi:DNA-nicking Smr family endonuclease